MKDKVKKAGSTLKPSQQDFTSKRKVLTWSVEGVGIENYY